MLFQCMLAGLGLADTMMVMHPLDMMEDLPVITLKAASGVGLSRSQYVGNDGCGNIEKSEFTKSNSLIPLNLIVLEGGCTVQTKVANAMAGKASSITILTDEELLKGARKIKGFSIFLLPTKYKIKFQKFPGNVGKDMILTEFKVGREDRKDQTLTAEVWGSAFDYSTYNIYQLLFTIIDANPILNTSLSIVPKFALYGCQSDQQCVQSYKGACVCNGAICSAKNQSQLSVEYIEEEMRIMAVYKEKGLAELRRYFTFFLYHCMPKGCSDADRQQELGYKFDFANNYMSEVRKCQGEAYNELMDEKKAFASIHEYPVLELNGKQIRSINYQDISKELCKAALTANLPKIDNLCNMEVSQEVSIFHYAWVGVLVAGLVLAGLCFYRKKYGQSLKRNQKMEINSAISNYFQFANQRK